MTGCPVEYAAEAAEAINMAELYLEHGLPPVRGGTLDQASIFIDTCNMVRNDQAQWRAELGIPK